MELYRVVEAATTVGQGVPVFVVRKDYAAQPRFGPATSGRIRAWLDSYLGASFSRRCSFDCCWDKGCMNHLTRSHESVHHGSQLPVREAGISLGRTEQKTRGHTRFLGSLGTLVRLLSSLRLGWCRGKQQKASARSLFTPSTLSPLDPFLPSDQLCYGNSQGLLLDCSLPGGVPRLVTSVVATKSAQRHTKAHHLPSLFALNPGRP